ncbi:tRNA (adenosine(37)-N6)-dimethylallyltransferase MiaA [Candidatus Venteria ishoeyi]|uniref:tRNA (adenosine(37)-N6)-dimethylallyltransferase MiaA n=1 Tax=Candidatus Venteria ishoeyi TaxID=1899563 RepID=UPI0025A50417|nr:tRNA (adenosine(37)-N6)-dimethylallyltransferase MiaA [Candidatus Venteria ishoeyi]MDM8545195.1 tRNA (adenosine(37)-N6)-dimethylallyltransferase MiaA [Candidatus Venteria ishoeyi]
MNTETTIQQSPPAIFLMGPTASGKTDLAVTLVQQFSCEIISVDSALVYRGMDIGTAKPDAQTLTAAPHRLLDIRSPLESYSAAEFRADALQAMHEITAQGKIPLLVGGTGLYFRALQQGLAKLPKADPKIREALLSEAEQCGWIAMHQKLQACDPQSAQKIHPNDPQRIQRALEVYELTGQPMSALVAASQPPPLPWTVIKMVLAPDKQTVLHPRIHKRFEQMLEQGLIEEVRALFQQTELNLQYPAMRAVGYRQVWLYLEGQLTYDEMIADATTATRRLAKRQLTWLRKEQNAHWFKNAEQALQWLQNCLT